MIIIILIKLEMFGITGSPTTVVIILGLGNSVVRLLAVGAKSQGFDFLITQDIHRLIHRAFTYRAVGSFVLSWSWTRQPGYISFLCF